MTRAALRGRHAGPQRGGATSSGSARRWSAQTLPPERLDRRRRRLDRRARPSCSPSSPRAHAWIRPCSAPAPTARTRWPDGRREAARPRRLPPGVARAARAGRRGRSRSTPTSTSTPDYFERLIGRFAADPPLGIASGTCYEREDGEWVRRTKAETTVWGASRAYRCDCLADVMALEPLHGLGRPRRDQRPAARHAHADVRRPAVPPPPPRGRPRAQPRCTTARRSAAPSWYMGYRPTYLTMRALYRARREPAALAMLWGYFGAAASGCRAARTRHSWRRCASASGWARRSAAAPRPRSQRRS